MTEDIGKQQPGPGAHQRRFKALPVVGGGLVGLVVAGGPGALLGAFIADAVTGGEGSRRVIQESKELIQVLKDTFKVQYGKSTQADGEATF